MQTDGAFVCRGPLPRTAPSEAAAGTDEVDLLGGERRHPPLDPHPVVARVERRAAPQPLGAEHGDDGERGGEERPAGDLPGVDGGIG